MRRLTVHLGIAAAATLIAAGPGWAGDEEMGHEELKGTPSDIGEERSGDGQVRDDEAMRQDPQMRQDQRSGASSARSSGEGEYVVEEGDTLATIAEKELGSASEWQVIARANQIDDPAQLRVGQKLTIPEAGERQDDEQQRGESREGTVDSFKADHP